MTTILGRDGDTCQAMPAARYALRPPTSCDADGTDELLRLCRASPPFVSSPVSDERGDCTRPAVPRCRSLLFCCELIVDAEGGVRVGADGD